MSWSMPVRRALNLAYVVTIDSLPRDLNGQINTEARAQVDDVLNPPPPPTAAERRAALMRRSLAFAAEHGGEIR